jgi:hypothetical protein
MMNNNGSRMPVITVIMTAIIATIAAATSSTRSGPLRCSPSAVKSRRFAPV